MLTIMRSTFNKFHLINSINNKNDFKLNPIIINNTFVSEQEGVTFRLTINDFSITTFTENRIKSKGGIWLEFRNGLYDLNISNNRVDVDHISLSFDGIEGRVIIKENDLSSTVHMSIDELNKTDDIDWPQFKHRLLTPRSFTILGLK